MSSQPIAAKPVVLRPRAHRRKLENRERILSEARRLFGRHGFAGVTTAEIAEAADVAKGSVFAQVGSKERLLVLVFQRDMNKWLDDAAARAGRGALLDQLERFFDAMLDGAADAPELTAVFMRELPYAHREPEVVAAMNRTYALLTDLVEAAKARGEITNSVDSTTLAHNLFSLYFNFQYIWLAQDMPPRAAVEPNLRERLAAQIGVLLRKRGRSD
ncbi:MAG TPA: TetR/AcrR family transcriptional regulator [Pseudomonadales bacterium]|nr:TetR/AcrR family transcriptional regulator [Pseudomonadales bacterium]